MDFMFVFDYMTHIVYSYDLPVNQMTLQNLSVNFCPFSQSSPIGGFSLILYNFYQFVSVKISWKWFKLVEQSKEVYFKCIILNAVDIMSYNHSVLSKIHLYGGYFLIPYTHTKPVI